MDTALENLYRFLNGINTDLNTIMNNYFIVIILLGFLVTATYTDIKCMKIYDKFNVIFLITRMLLIFMPVVGLEFTLNNLVGGIAGFLFLLIPAMALMHQMGGDIKFMGVLGLYLGFYATIILLIISCIYNIIYSIVSIFVLKRSKAKTNIPFAPFFLLAFITLIIISLI